MLNKSPDDILTKLRASVRKNISRARSLADLEQRKEMYLASYKLKYGSLAEKVWEEMYAAEIKKNRLS
jgi:hypothetical protein